MSMLIFATMLLGVADSDDNARITASFVKKRKPTEDGNPVPVALFEDDFDRNQRRMEATSPW